MATSVEGRRSSKSAGASKDRPLNTNACYTKKFPFNINQTDAPTESQHQQPQCYGDPQAWLTDGLGQIVNHKITQLDELMP